MWGVATAVSVEVFPKNVSAPHCRYQSLCISTFSVGLSQREVRNNLKMEDLQIYCITFTSISSVCAAVVLALSSWYIIKVTVTVMDIINIVSL